jgi:hypothetical protein
LDLVDLISQAKPTTSQTDNPSQIALSHPTPPDRCEYFSNLSLDVKLSILKERGPVFPSTASETNDQPCCLSHQLTFISLLSQHRANVHPTKTYPGFFDQR